MERGTERIISALSSLQGNPDWVVLKEWMVKSRDEALKTSVMTKDEVQLRWLQGSAQTLNEIIDLSDKAMGIMHRKRTGEE